MISQKMRPLVERLEGHIDLEPVSLHVPGHKNGGLYPEKWQPFLKYDLTEITGLDDLYHSEAAIEEARQLLAACYGAKKSYFLVNGTTGGNLAMILAAVGHGEKVLLPRDVHKSILHGLELAGAVPIFLTAAVDPKIGVASGVSCELLEEAFVLHPDIAVCIFTYPSYYGTVFDLAACIGIAHRYKAVVLVDEAHGAHFAAHPDFPTDALQLGADVVVQSAHKTLPAMTMGSFLHVASDHPRLQEIPRYLQMVQSSSPSYLIMASLDIARHYTANYQAADWVAFQKMRTEWQKALTSSSFEVLTPADPLKLIVRRSGCTGFELLDEFEQNGYFPELADERQVLLILPLLKEGGAFPAPVKWQSSRSRKEKMRHVQQAVAMPGITELAISYEAMRRRATEFLPIEEAVGYVAAENVMTYPPGIPELIRGERVAAEHVAILQTIQTYHYQGGEKLHENKLKVFKKI